MSAHRVADLVTAVSRAVVFGLIALTVVIVGRAQRKPHGTMQERMSDTKARQRALEVANRTDS